MSTPFKLCCKYGHNDWVQFKSRRKCRPCMIVSRDAHREQYMLRRAFADSYKVGGCVDCGNKNLTVLDFDHVRGKKTASLSALFNQRATFDRILEEIEKCEVRCANCHRIVTAGRRRLVDFFELAASLEVA